MNSHFFAKKYRLWVSVVVCFYSLVSIKIAWGCENDLVVDMYSSLELDCKVSFTISQGSTSPILGNGKNIEPFSEVYANDPIHRRTAYLEGSSFYGPAAQITYNCTDPSLSNTPYSISFKVSQPYSLFKGHEPKATILSSNGLTLDYYTKYSPASSSYGGLFSYSTPGHLDISIFKT